MTSNMRKLWHRFTAVHATDEDTAQQEYMTKVILVMLNVIGLGFTAAFTIGAIAGGVPLVALIITGSIQLFLLGGWWLTNRGYWRATSYTFPTMFFLLALRTNYANGVGAAAMLQYAIAVLLAAMLQGGKAQWITLALSIGAYLGMGWMHVEGRFPAAPAPEDDFLGFAISVSGMLLFIAILQWFYTSQFRRTIVELAEHRASLEQRVAERTAELQENLIEREQLQQQVIEAQRLAIKELSTPIIPIMDAPDGSGSVIIMPLIGSIDSMRARDVTRALLAGIRQHRAQAVLLDITGISIVDSGVAKHLNKTIQVARLKGAHTIVTGVSDAVAETIVNLGIDWSQIETVADLQTGLQVALKAMRVTKQI